MPDVENENFNESIVRETDRDVNRLLAAGFPLFVLWLTATIVTDFLFNEEAIFVGFGGFIYIAGGLITSFWFGIHPRNYLFVSTFCKDYWKMMLIWPFAFLWRSGRELINFYKS